MALLSNQIEQYMGRSVNFLTEVILQNDGTGDYIKEWNISEKDKPTDSQLAAVDAAANTAETNKSQVAKRVAEYGTIEQQLEYIVENGIDAFITQQKAIKEKYPKS